MVDLADGVEVRNYGLKRTPDPRILQESLALILPLAVIAGALSFHIWIRSQIIYTGYQKQDLKIQEEVLSRDRQHLVVEEQMLRNPKRLDEIAIKQLDMILVRPDQIIPAPIRNWNVDNSKTALVGNLARPDEQKKTSSLD
jgi:cell division protein FtsL